MKNYGYLFFMKTVGISAMATNWAYMCSIHMHNYTFFYHTNEDYKKDALQLSI